MSIYMFFTYMHIVFGIICGFQYKNVFEREFSKGWIKLIKSDLFENSKRYITFSGKFYMV